MGASQYGVRIGIKVISALMVHEIEKEPETRITGSNIGITMTYQNVDFVVRIATASGVLSIPHLEI